MYTTLNNCVAGVDDFVNSLSCRTKTDRLITCKRSSARRRSSSASRNTSSHAANAPWCTPYAAVSRTCCSTSCTGFFRDFSSVCKSKRTFPFESAEIQDARRDPELIELVAIEPRQCMRTPVPVHAVY